MSPLFTGLLPQVLRSRAEVSRDRPFFHMVGQDPVTYGEAYARACAVAGGLIGLGVQRGECVAIMAENSAESLSTWLGINLAGAVEVAVNTAYRGHSLAHVLNNSQARVVFVQDALLPRLAEIRGELAHARTVVVYGAADVGRPQLLDLTVHRFADILGPRDTDPAVPIGPHDLASVVYTSGTTGPAKGVMMPHGQVSLFARLGVEGARMTEEDVHYCFIPLFHVAGKYMAILGSMMTGGKVVIDTRFSAEHWLPRVRAYGATLSHVHGPLVEMIHQQPERDDDGDNPVTRIIASPFPAKIAEDFQRRFRLRGIETWGMTEVTVPVWQPYEEPLRVGSCGRLRQDLFELRIVDPDSDEEVPPGRTGELVLRPRRPWTIMQGYLRNPEATLAAWRNLWFHTGDLGYLDRDGYLYFVDRAKERIRRRAENISSYEIEAAALTHPAVEACAAVGVPSEFEGDDDVKLCVVPAPGTRIAPRELVEYLARRLPHFMVPRYIEYLDTLSRTPTGKPQKALLREAGVTEDTWDRKAAGVSLRQVAGS
jgi:crotonobetaine/carnitine-CoA ligase